MNFGKEKEVEIFKALASESQFQVGLKYGFDKVYKNGRAVRNAITAIYTKVKNNPEEYGLSLEVVGLVEAGMKNRAVARQGGTPMEKPEMGVMDIKEKIVGIRDKTFHLIDKKLDRVASSKKRLDAISFKDLGIIAGIAFDKTQILRGEATENVAVLGKIETDLSPEAALDLVLKMREKTVEVKHDK